MASPNISFDRIPSSIRKPGAYFEFNTRLAVNTLPGNQQRVLVIGQMRASPASTVQPLQLVDVFSDADAAVYFGAGSYAHRMVRAAITANPYVQLTVVGMADAAAGVVATGKVTVTGAATAAGSLSVFVGKEKVSIAVDTGDTITEMATALAKAVNDLVHLPVTAAAAAGVATFTAKHKGLEGNNIRLAAQAQTTGVSLAATAMAGGQNDPALDEALAAAFAAGHNIVVTPFATQQALASLRAHLDAVADPREHRGAIGVAALPTTLSAATTLATATNGQYVTLALHAGSVMQAADIAAAYASVIAFEEDPARPLNTLAVAGLDVPDPADRLGRVEQENALYNGVTPFEVGPGDVVQIVRSITTYTVNPAGVPDIAMLDITTPRTLFYVEQAIRQRLALRFPREKLFDEQLLKVRSEALVVLYQLQELEIVEHVLENQAGVVCERDSQDPNRVNLRLPVDVVNGLHIIAGRIDLIL